MEFYVFSLILLTFSHLLPIHTTTSLTSKSQQQLLNSSLVLQYSFSYLQMPSSTSHNLKSLKQWQDSIILLNINQTKHWICFFTVIFDIEIMCVDIPNITLEGQYINIIMEKVVQKNKIIVFISDGFKLSHVKTAFIEDSILKLKEFIKITQVQREISSHQLKNHNLIDKLVIQLVNVPKIPSSQHNKEIRHIRMLNEVSITSQFNNWPSQCWYGCNSCNLQLQICLSCQSGYQLSEGQFCKPNFILIISSLYLMLGFGTFHHAFVADLFFAQFSYEEYFAQQNQLSEIYQFVGNVNRQKIAPYYLKILLQDLFKLLRPLKYSIIPQQSTYSTDNNFLTKQQSPAHYTSNVLYILLINIPILLIIFMFLKLIFRIATKLGLQLRFFTKNSSLCGFLLILLQTNGQYLTFMFWKQIIIPSFTSITDKFNLIFCLVFTFFIFTLCLSIYPYSDRTYSDYKIQILFPLSKQHTLKSLVESILFGPNRYILIGSIHSINLVKPIKLIFLVSLNILCIFFMKNLPSTYSKSQIFYKRIYFLLALGINFTHLLTFGNQPMQFYNSLRFLFIIIIISLIAIELLFFFSNQLISKFNGFFRVLTSRRTSRIASIDQDNTRPTNEFKMKIKSSAKDSKKYNS